MSSSKPSSVKNIAVVPGVSYLTAVIYHANDGGGDWAHAGSLMAETMETARQVDHLLADLPARLNISKKVHVRSSVLVPLPNNSMVSLVSRDSKTGPFYSHTAEKLRWGTKPIGIAGVCASKKILILISDLGSIPNDFKKYWVASTSPVGGIIALPIMASFSTSGSRDSLVCIAVLSIAASKPGVLNERNLAAVRDVAEELKLILLGSTLVSRLESRTAVVEELFNKTALLSDQPKAQSTKRSTTPRVQRDASVRATTKQNQELKELKNIMLDFTKGFDELIKNLARGDVVMGNKYSFGNINGSIVNIDSVLHQVTQSVGSTSDLDQIFHNQLAELIQQLRTELQKVPEARKEETEALAEAVRALIEAGTRQQPNKTTTKINAEGLKQTAEIIASENPKVLQTSMEIIKTVLQRVGKSK